MKIKDTINFKTLREKGPKAIEINGEEVVQVVSSNKEILYVVTQEYLMKLLTMENALLIQNGLKEEKIVSGSEMAEHFKDFTHRLEKIESLVKEDKKEFAKKKRKTS